MGKPMLRLTAIFIAVCVVLIAASLGAVVYLLLGLSTAESAIVALAALATLTIYKTVSSRARSANWDARSPRSRTTPAISSAV